MPRILTNYKLASALLVAFVLLTGCGGRDSSPESLSGKRGARPPVVDLLEGMPESAVAVLAAPSARDLGESVEYFLLRASPESINMEAEIRVVMQQMGRMVGVPNARSLDDIAFESGIDPQRPIAIYVGADQSSHIEDAISHMASESDSEEPPVPMPLAMGASRLGEEFAFAGYVLDADIAGQAFEVLLGETGFVESEVAGIPAHVSKDDTWCYLTKDEIFLAGSVGLVTGAVARRSNPYPVRYGAEDCPADPSDRLVALTRLDRLPSANAESSGPMGEAASTGVAEPMSGVLSNLQSLTHGPDPLITVCRIQEATFEILTRLDREKHPELAEWRGTPRALHQLSLLPADTVGVLSIDFGGDLREMMVNAAKNAVEAEGSAAEPGFSPGAMIGPVIEVVGGNVTVAVAGSESGDAAVLLMVDVLDGDNARARIRASGLMPLVSETYNGTDICILPIPMPVGDGLSYAVPNNTFVLATDLDRLKTAIDWIGEDHVSGWAASQTPSLDPDEPRFATLVVQPNRLAEAIAPQLEAQAVVDPSSRATAQLLWEKIREVRVTTGVNGGWQEALLTISAE